MPRARGHFCGSAEHLLSRRAFLGTTGGLLAGSAGLDMLGSPALAQQLKQEQKRAR